MPTTSCWLHEGRATNNSKAARLLPSNAADRDSQPTLVLAAATKAPEGTSAAAYLLAAKRGSPQSTQKASAATVCARTHTENTAAAAQSERKERAAAKSARDDKKRAQKSGVSQRRRLAARKQKRRSRRYRRFINPSLRLVESFGSASAVAATPKRNFGTFSRSTGRTHIFAPSEKRSVRYNKTWTLQRWRPTSSDTAVGNLIFRKKRHSKSCDPNLSCTFARLHTPRLNSVSTNGFKHE